MRVPPPLEQRLDITAGIYGAVELREAEKVIARGRPVLLDISHIPPATFPEAEDAARRTPYDESNHNNSTCFVCGPARAQGDGLRVFPGPLHQANTGAVAASWVPYANLARDDGRIAPEFVWAALNCPTGYAGLAARHLELSGAETILLGRMAARIDQRPRPGDQCILAAWPTGRDGRKLLASSAMLTPDGQLLAAARAT